MKHGKSVVFMAVGLTFCYSGLSAQQQTSSVVGEVKADSNEKAFDMINKEIYRGTTDGLRKAEKYLRRLSVSVEELQKNTFTTAVERHDFVRASVEKDEYADCLAELLTAKVLQKEITPDDARCGEKLRTVHKVLSNLHRVKEEGSAEALNKVTEGLVALNSICEETSSQVAEGTEPVAKAKPAAVADTSKKAKKAAEKTAAVAEAPKKVAEKTAAVADTSKKAKKAAEKTAAVAEAPKKVAEKTAAVAEAPKKVAEKTAAVAEAPKKAAEKTAAVAEAPKKVAEKTAAVAEAPKKVAEKTAAVAEAASEEIPLSDELGAFSTSERAKERSRAVAKARAHSRARARARARARDRIQELREQHVITDAEMVSTSQQEG
jgi:hypothetical protein